MPVATINSIAMIQLTMVSKIYLLFVLTFALPYANFANADRLTESVDEETDGRKDDTCSSILQTKMDDFRAEMESVVTSLQNDVQSLHEDILRVINASTLLNNAGKDSKGCDPLFVENGFASPCVGIPSGSRASVGCIKGFALDGVSTVTCFDGKYDHTPECKAGCKALQVSNGVVKPTTHVDPGTTVRVECQGPYTLVGSPTPTCDNGLFDARPQCLFDVSALRVVKKTSVSIKQAGDKSFPWVTGSRFLDDGRLLFCDYQNKKVNLMSTSLELEDTLDLRPDDEKPYDVAIVNHTTAIVTIPDKNKLMYIQLVPRLERGRVLTIDKSCYGIDFFNGTIYVTCHNHEQGHARLLDMDGNLIATRGLENEYGYDYEIFKKPCHLAVSRVSGMVCVSDWGKGLVTCFDAAGNKSYTTRGLRFAKQIMIDDVDNVLVASPIDKALKVLDRNGDKKTDLLTSDVGADDVEMFAIRRSDGTLMLGDYENKSVLLFQLLTSI